MFAQDTEFVLNTDGCMVHSKIKRRFSHSLQLLQETKQPHQLSNGTQSRLLVGTFGEGDNS